MHWHNHSSHIWSSHLIFVILEIKRPILPCSSGWLWKRSDTVILLAEEQLFISVHHHASSLRLILVTDGWAHVHHVRTQLVSLGLNLGSFKFLLCLIAVVNVSLGFFSQLFQLHLEFFLLAPHFILKFIEFKVESSLNGFYHRCSN